MARKKAKTKAKKKPAKAKKRKKGFSLPEKIVLGLVGTALLGSLLVIGVTQLRHWQQTRNLVTLKAFKYFGQGQIEGGFDLALDKRGWVYLLDLDANAVLKYDLDGRLLRRWGRKGSRPGEFNEPYGLGVSRAGDIYVADTWNGRIQRFSEDGRFLGAFGRPGQFYGPRDVAVDGTGNLYVADAGQHQVEKIRADGEPSATWGDQVKCSRRKDGFCEPRSLEVDGDGNVYVHDVGNRRVKSLGPTGKSLALWKVKWAKPKEQDYPFISVGDDGNIYLSCPTEGVVASYTPQGRLRAYYRLEGEGFRYPTGVVFARGKLYVVNRDTKNVVVCEVPR